MLLGQANEKVAYLWRLNVLIIPLNLKSDAIIWRNIEYLCVIVIDKQHRIFRSSVFGLQTKAR